MLVSADTVPHVYAVCDETCSSGDTVMAAVKIENAEDYAAVSFRLQYDSERMTVVSASVGSEFASGLITINDSYSDNEIFMSYTGTNSVSVSGELLTVKFKLNNTAEGTADFEITNLKLRDINSAAIAAETSGASMSIVYSPAAVRPIAESLTAESGKTFKVSVVAEKLTDYCAISFRLAYDSDKFTLVSTNQGSVFTGGLFTVNEKYSANEIFVSYTSATPSSSNGELLTLEFIADNNAEGDAIFAVTNLKVKDEASADLDVYAAQSLVTVVYVPASVVPVVDEANLNTGSDFTLSVVTDKLSEYCALSFKIVYDSEKFSLSSVTQGSEFSDGMFTVNEKYSENEVFVSYICASAVSTNGIIAELGFAVKDNVAGEAVFEILNLKVKDVNSSSIDVFAGEDSVNVVCLHIGVSWTVATEASCGIDGLEEFSCACGYYDSKIIEQWTHSYTSTVVYPTETSTGYIRYSCSKCGDEYIDTNPPLGDMNSDFVVDIMDVLIAIKALLNRQYDNYPDMNGDNMFSLIDIIRLLKIAVAEH